MAVAMVKERWPGRVMELVIGREPHAVKAGGESTLPFLHFEGEIPNRPLAALEVWDVEPEGWPETLAEAYPGVTRDPVAWAKMCEDCGADLICLRLAGAHPEGKNAGPAQAAETARAVAAAVNRPLIVIGCGVEEKDEEILPAVAGAIAGQNALLGCATMNNYKKITEACLSYGHGIIASTPLDINLAKQLNILINETGIPLDRIAFDPIVGPLGYGFEYAYSIIERARLSALSGDRMLATPVICFVGQEAWKTREARSEDGGGWGDQARRAILWEALTAAGLALAGGSIFVLSHPASLNAFKKHLAAMMKPFTC
ncbi:CO dehydrogenase/acetyl-CoA synthase delta subunit [Pelotomaculum thermopropionicum SI]|uniref:CO dehydrogenase/acetyl-CoA synthase delta subunit n=1 Tax=Pelotomaculum thermopropionicum (strain DSM 13744 / JCM 10971 / SI) TaxID=370438 RepID=A5D3L1_PELTS|nr:CO dehydrogenase/acetyl-CoA synthase delta subunit [Pelotomaculum thermopropionicum SI]